ncbi:AgmX/PglI C-terminal domain-containing protein [Bdellovibrionota bacterium FG-1]
MTHDSNKTTLDKNQHLRAARDAIAAQERKVVIMTGGLPGESRTFRLDKDRVVIGSVISADVRLTGDGVAPIHAVVELVPEPMIYDLASETGVFVNGTKVVTAALKNGDEITVGLNRIRFAVEERGQAISQVAKDRIRETEGRKLFLNPDEDFKPLLLEESSEVDDIFDYRPAAKTALEVVMSWHGSILDIEHFVAQKQIVIGVKQRDDFAIPPLLAAAEHPIVTRTGDNFVLNLDPSMRGVIQRRGSLKTLDEARSSVVKTSVGYPVNIEREDFAKVSVGEVDFFLSFTDAPPRLKRSRVLERDSLFRKIFTASLLFTLVTLYGLGTMRVVPSLEAEQIPERLATILYQPEKYAVRVKPEPIRQAPVAPAVSQPAPPAQPRPQVTHKVEIHPDANSAKHPIPKEMNVGSKPSKVAVVSKRPAPSKGQSEAKEGEGARHSGPEGKRGTLHAPADKTPQNKAAVPSPNGGKGAGGGHSEVADIGNVDFLKGATGKIENILGNAGAQLGKSGDSLKGLGGFATQGNGGLALSGNGKGGGGTSDLSAGLGNRGRGFGKVGTGLGAAGNGTGILGGQARVAIRSGGNEETVVMGSIDANAIDAAIRAHQDEFRLCYEREINAEHPNIGGRIGTTFVIGSTGRVTEAGIESSSIKNANIERCVLTVMKRIDFPMPRGGGLVQVAYPFKFSPIGH